MLIGRITYVRDDAQRGENPPKKNPFLNYEPLLYQLSYVGTSGANIASTGAGYKRSTCSRLATRSDRAPPSHCKALCEVFVTRAPARLTETRLQRQYEGLANFAERDAFWSVTKHGLEAFYRFPQRLETEPERLVMHRHDKFRASSGCHFHRLFRCAM
jgi:hypothetical protein